MRAHPPAPDGVPLPSPTQPQRDPALVLLAPGQGSLRPGALVPWLESAPPGLVEDLSTAVGLDLLALGTTAGAEEVTATEVAQPLTLVVSVLSALGTGLAQLEPRPVPDGTSSHASDAWVRLDPWVVAVAGHSLGYLTALTLAGVLPLADTAALARARGLAMAECGRQAAGGMVALVGGEREAVLAAIQAAGLTAANINSSAQVVASGAREALARLAPPAGCRAVPLAVSGAFHSPLVAGAVAPVSAQVRTLVSSGCICPSACLLIDDADARLRPAGSPGTGLVDAAAEKITRPVRWDLVTAELRRLAPTRLVELAPAGTLAGLARRDLREIPVTRLRQVSDGVGLTD